jgi:TadE-like protein
MKDGRPLLTRVQTRLQTRVQTHVQTRWKRSGERSREKGASAVEGAIILPLFLGLIVGVMEIGVLMQHQAETRQAVASSTRLASLAGNNRSADFEILTELKQSLKSQVKSVGYVIVFKAENGASGAPASCIAEAEAGNNGVDDVCNVYTAAQLDNPDPALFGYSIDEPLRVADIRWPAGDRSATYTGGRDLVGVQITATHRSMTGLFPSTSDRYVSVLRLEAQGV